MMNCAFKDINEMRDVESINKYAELLSKGISEKDAWATILAGSRDNSRTPMCWNDSENAGFTTGTPWIRLNGDYKECNAEAEIADANSPYNYYKALMALRTANKSTLVYGDFKPIKTDDKTYCLYRESTDGKFYIEMNLTENEIARPRTAEGNCVLSSYDSPASLLRPYEVNIYKVK